ncbi:MAG: hypothetical protein ACOZBW_01360 [Thermodesulfobacteriota bacterium]
MKTVRLFVCLGLVALMAAFWGCGRPEMDFGSFAGNVYKNKYLDMTVSLPEGVSIDTQQKASASQGAKASELQTLTLFTAYLYPDNTEVAFNANFMAMAERIDKTLDVKTGRDYHLHTRKLIEATPIPVTFSPDITPRTLDGKAFDLMQVEIPLAQVTVKQDIYAAAVGDYILVLAASYTNPDEKAALEKMLESVSF